MNTTKELSELAKRYLTALLSKNRKEAGRMIMESLENGYPIKDIYLFVFQPTQWEIGNLWQKNKITVAMEHYCTAATQFIMSRLYSYIFTFEKKNDLIMVATSVSGELHELGIRMVTDFFEMEGWNTYYLGANTTKEGVLEMIKDCNAHLLAISATIYFNITFVRELINYVRNNTKGNKVKIIVGGNAFKKDQALWKDLKADMYAVDAQDAIDKVTEAFSLR
jgi:methanogenic corrinoid protein MtbC1